MVSILGDVAAGDDVAVLQDGVHLNPADVAGPLGGYGWREREQLGPAEFTARYPHPTGRDQPVAEVERSVLAEFTG